MFKVRYLCLLCFLWLNACAHDTLEIHTIDMDSVEPYLFDDGWQFVDLRSDHELDEHGFINGFNQIAFYEDMVDQNILSPHTQGQFDPSLLHDQAALEALFDRDKHIVLICRRGVRAHYVQAALKHLGYENVHNAGAVSDYQGPHIIKP